MEIFPISTPPLFCFVYQDRKKSKIRLVLTFLKYLKEEKQNTSNNLMIRQSKRYIPSKNEQKSDNSKCVCKNVQ